MKLTPSVERFWIIAPLVGALAFALFYLAIILMYFQK